MEESLELEEDLRLARLALDEFLKSWSSAEGWQAQFLALSRAVYDAERSLAKARREQYALPLEIPIQWSSGAPLPTLVSDGHSTYLVFRTKATTESSTVLVGHPRVRTVGLTTLGSHGIVLFERSVSVRFGLPGDEHIQDHPLFGRGLVAHAPHEVFNSAWINELKSASNLVEGGGFPALKHFLFSFHDHMFECLAERITVEKVEGVFGEVLENITKRLHPS